MGMALALHVVARSLPSGSMTEVHVVAHRDPRAALVFVNTGLDQTAAMPALHLGLERLRLKAKPRSNRFRSDDNRTVGDGVVPGANKVIA
jgi:hypothetical protein